MLRAADLDRVGTELSEDLGVLPDVALQREDADLHLAASETPRYARLPAALGQLDVELADLLAPHGVTQAAADLGDDLRIAVVRGGLDDGGREAGRVRRLEDSGAHEHRLGTQLH